MFYLLCTKCLSSSCPNSFNSSSAFLMTQYSWQGLEPVSHIDKTGDGTPSLSQSLDRLNLVRVHSCTRRCIKLAEYSNALSRVYMLSSYKLAKKASNCSAASASLALTSFGFSPTAVFKASF